MDHFRVYDSIIDDPKILALSMEFRWYFVAVLASSSRQVERGSLPTLTDLALHLRVTQGKIKRVVAFFIEHGFIDEDVETKRLTVHGWHKRQFKSDVSTERVKRFRNSERNDPETPEARETVESSTSISINTLNSGVNQNTNSCSAEKRSELAERFVLPDWIDRQDWDDWEKARKPKPTLRAKQLALGELIKFRAAGLDTNAIVRQSILRGYRSFFPVKSDSGYQTHGSTNGQAVVQSPRPKYLNVTGN